MTPDDALTKIEAELAAATPGPWVVRRMFEGWDIYQKGGVEDCVIDNGGMQRKDAELISHAPTYLAALVEVARCAAKQPRACARRHYGLDLPCDNCKALWAALDALTKAVQ